MANKCRSIANIAVFSLSVLVLTACGTSVSDPQVQDELPPAAITITEQPEVSVPEEILDTEESIQEQGTDPVTVFSPGFELGSSSLVATDPATVNLTSDQIQVLEFFAFW